MTVLNSVVEGPVALTYADPSYTITENGGIEGHYGYAALNAFNVPNAFIENDGFVTGGKTSTVEPALFTNLGSGYPQGIGVAMAGGTLINDGSITGGAGYQGVSNNGKYYAPGTGGPGVYARQPTHIDNSGAISGGVGGPSAGSVVYSTGGDGIDLSAGGDVDNSGLISGGAGGKEPSTATSGGNGGFGINLGGAGSVTNFGTIEGGNGTGPEFGYGGTGIIFRGKGTLDNAAGATIEGGAATFKGIGGIGVVLDQGGTINDAGRIDGGAGDDSRYGYGAVLFSGTLNVEQGGSVSGGNYAAADDGAAGVVLFDGAKVETAGTISGGYGLTQGDSVSFKTNSGTMIVSHGAVFNGSVGGFVYGDAIDLTNVSLGFVTSHFNAKTDTVNGAADGTLQFAGDPQLLFSDDGDGGTWITCACFRRGTLIATGSGERAVDSLKIGDRIMTQSGELRAIRWIGQRHYSSERLAQKPQMKPVRIQAGALGDHLPRRDLWVSPEHALYVQGVLVPAALLTNGFSIVTDQSVTSVSYFHLEFDSHAIVFAEGAPAESFVDDNSRQMFDNADEYARLYPDAVPARVSFCAPRLEDGEALQMLRLHLADLAGLLAVPMSQPELRRSV
jgi:hypothetical protein